ncbi:hypothetical protein EBX93_11610 [bacterium]|nr:hypothetical protein [bacterium]
MMDAEYRQLKASVNHAHETLMNAQRDYQRFITAVRKGKDFWHEAFGVYETGWKDVRWMGDTPVTIEQGSDTHVTEGSIAEYAFKLEQGKNGLGVAGFDPALFLQLYRERLDEIQQAEHEHYE